MVPPVDQTAQIEATTATVPQDFEDPSVKHVSKQGIFL